MRKYLIIGLFICTSLISNSQESGDFRFGVYTQLNSYRGNEMPMSGVSGEFFISPSFSLNYKYGLGLNNSGDYTMHFNPSIFGLLYVNSVELFILSFVIPEGVSYHVYPRRSIELAPYINPLGSEFNFYESPNVVLSCSFGINIHLKPTENLSISPNLGGMVFYRNGELMPSMGVSLNYNIQGFR